MTTNFHRLRSCLQSEHRRLVEELEQLKTTIRQADEQREGNPFDKWEEGAIKEWDRYLALQKQMIDRLSEVDHALRKFEQGTYGLCDACEEPIDSARLGALPEATLCVSCKARQPGITKSRLSPRGIGRISFSEAKWG